ncbi:MAG: LURP-one-related family protein [Bacilli bacterium]|nr:LURP-one-related family protein [Bacilli bacterium]MBN2876186.1 LURP-one-related family protein [Bacilli bacterium]
MKYYIKQKVFSFKDQFNITDDAQNLKYQIKGKFMSITNKLDLMDQNGSVLLHAHRKVLTFMPKYFIEDDKGQEVAMIQRLFAFRPKFKLQVRYKELTVSGSLFAHSFVISDDGEPVASIQKKIISWGDTYEIDIVKEEDVELFLFVVIVLDQVIHERKRRY